MTALSDHWGVPCAGETTAAEPKHRGPYTRSSRAADAADRDERQPCTGRRCARHSTKAERVAS